MAAPMLAQTDSRDAALGYVWNQYHTWAATARRLKSELSSWRSRVLAFSIAGAILGTLCQLSTASEVTSRIVLLPTRLVWLAAWLPTVLGVLSAIALGLATYFTKELLSPKREKRWVRARSAAERLKSEAYLLMAKAPPYHTSDVAELFTRIDKMTNDLKDITAVTTAGSESSPISSISVDQYIQERVDDQINKFYLPRINEHERVVGRGRKISLGLGALAVILGALGMTGWTASWVAVITTAIAAIASYLYAGRYQYLVVSYQATARRLDMLRARWRSSGQTDADTAERNQFILDCEDTISTENGAWMAEWTRSVQ